MSDDSEKKISLEELPDEGSSSFSAVPPKTPKIKKAPVDPRLTTLRSLKSDSAKVEMMEQYWHFDKKQWSFTWLTYVVILFIIQRLELYKDILANILQLDEMSLGFGGAFAQPLYDTFSIVIKNPIIFLIFTPVFFKFKIKSEQFFNITFNGISTVKTVITRDSKELTTRVFIKWQDIVKVEKAKAGEREILRMYSSEGKIGEIIWDIDQSKKEAVKQLLAGMVSPKHPFREFFSKGSSK